MKNLPAFRYFLYVLGTVNAVMAGVVFLVSLAFNEGVNIVTITLVLLIVNVVGVVTVMREFKGQR